MKWYYDRETGKKYMTKEEHMYNHYKDKYYKNYVKKLKTEWFEGGWWDTDEPEIEITQPEPEHDVTEHFDEELFEDN